MRSRFFISLGFAAIAALAVVPWLIAAAPLIGFDAALGLFAALATATYLFVIAPQKAKALPATLIVCPALGLGWLFLPGSPSRLLMLLLAIGLVRSGFFYRRRPARALAVELALGLGSMLAAAWLTGPTVLSHALLVWGVGLTQSLYFLTTDIDVKSDSRPIDAFEGAHDRAMRLLDQTGH